MDKEQIYKTILANLSLSNHDRTVLKNLRGFDSEACNRLQLKTIHENAYKEPWAEGFPEEIKTILSKENILIPYFDKDGEVIYLRPHKSGIKGEGSRIFIPWGLCSKEQYNGTTIVIAESEFKAAASCIMGVPAIGVPGISSFSRKKFPALLEEVLNLNPKHIVICFDNEIKDNPEFKNYKSDFTRRYDTEIYSYLIAKSLESAFKKQSLIIPVFISRIGKEWMIEGKADIDGCLAKGMTPAQWKATIDSTALSPTEYRKTFYSYPEAHQSFIHRKIDSFFYDGKIQENFKCYFYKNKKENIKLSNFVINIIHSIKGDEGTSRLIQLDSNYGKSKPTKLTPEIMASKASFAKFCYSQGDFSYTGPDSALADIWEYLFMFQDGKIVNTLDYFGYNKDYDMWVFGNGVFKNDKFYQVDDSNIVTINDIGYNVLDAEVSTEIIPPILSDVDPEFTLSAIVEHLANLTNKNHARHLIAWIIGNLFMPEINETYGAYPFLFLYGTLASGKSTIADIAMSFFGNTDAKGLPLEASSVVGLTRVASRYSSIPMWIEEFRNNVSNKVGKLNYLRSIYDKSTIVKGTKKAGEIMTYKARASVIISGEEYPNDAALVSRCFVMNINKDKHNSPDNKASFMWIKNNKSSFSFFVHTILQNKKFWWELIKKNIDEYIVSFKNSKKISERLRTHQSILGGIADAFLGENKEYSDFIRDSSYEMETKIEDNQALNMFWDDILALASEGKIKQKFYSILENYNRTDYHVAINVNGLYSVWETTYSILRRETPMAKSALLDHLKKEDYFVRCERALIDKETRRCYIFDFNNHRIPEQIKQLIEHYEKDKDLTLNIESGYHDKIYQR